MNAGELSLVAFAIIFGCLGNAVVLVVSYFSTSFKTKCFVVLVVADLLCIFPGPTTLLIEGPWLEEHSVVCKMLGFLRNLTLFAPLLALLSLMLFYRHFCQSLSEPGKGLRIFVVAIWILVVTAISAPPLLDWDSYSYQAPLHSCWHSMAPRSLDDRGYSVFVGIVSLSIHSVTLGLVYAAVRARRRYRLRLQWLRHRTECKLNDPERTTVQSSNASNNSRSSSFDNLLLALANSKLPVTDTLKSLQEKLSEETERRERPCPSPDRINDETGPSVAENYDAESKEGKLHAHAQDEMPRRLLTVTPPHYARRKMGTRTRLPRYRGTKSIDYALKDQRNSQYLKLLTILACLSLIGWFPYYVAMCLSAKHAQSFTVAAWLPYLRSILSPLLYVLLSSEYRGACKMLMLKMDCLSLHQSLTKRQGSVELNKLQYNSREENRSVSLINIHQASKCKIKFETIV